MVSRSRARHRAARSVPGLRALAPVVALLAALMFAVVPPLRSLAERSPALVGAALGSSSHSAIPVPSAARVASGPRPASAVDPGPGSLTRSAAPSTATPAATAATADGADYRVVGLGDSVPAAGACGCTSYVSLVGGAAARARGRTASVANLAVGGLTTAGLVEQLADPAVQAKLSDADLVIITIGANDFDPGVLATPACRPLTVLPCYQDVLRAQRGRLASVLTEVDRLAAARPRTVLITGYWNVFLDGAVAREQGDDYVQGSTTLTLAENALISSVGSGLGAVYVDLYTPFRGADGTTDDTSLLMADADHPNQAGHDLIARTLLAALGGP